MELWKMIAAAILSLIGGFVLRAYAFNNDISHQEKVELIEKVNVAFDEMKDISDTVSIKLNNFITKDEFVKFRNTTNNGFAVMKSKNDAFRVEMLNMTRQELKEFKKEFRDELRDMRDETKGTRSEVSAARTEIGDLENLMIRIGNIRD